MIIVRATQKLLNIQKLKPEPIDLGVTELPVFGEWFANTISSSFKGKSLVIYVHSPSLVTIVTVGKTIKKTFPDFKTRFLNLTKRFNFPQKFIDDLVTKFEEPIITKTNNRSMLSYLNKIADHLNYRMLMCEDFVDIDFEEEENIMMNYLFGGDKKPYFTPRSYWNYYFLGEDPFQKIDRSNVKEQMIALIPDQNKLSRSENLHMENQLMKLQIEDILGGKIMGNNQNQIPTEIENMFLKNIIEFEKNVKTSKEITVMELLGHPTFKPADSITEKKLKTELEKVFSLLHKKFVHIDFLGDYDDLLKYKFITEELINKETQSLNIPGMITHFIYEEFYPNHELDIKDRVNEFLNKLVSTSEEDDPKTFNYFCGDPFRLNNEEISIEELFEKAKYFSLIYNDEEVREYRRKDLNYNLEKNKAMVTGTLLIKKETSKIKVPMKFYLNRLHDWWEIVGLDFELLP